MNWRPIKTAPKDEQILLAYTGSDGETRYSGQGRWVEWVHSGHAMNLIRDGKPVPDTYEPHWEIAYVAKMQTGGAHRYFSWQERCWTPYDVTHWMPLPVPSAIRPKRRK